MTPVLIPLSLSLKNLVASKVKRQYWTSDFHIGGGPVPTPMLITNYKPSFAVFLINK